MGRLEIQLERTDTGMVCLPVTNVDFKIRIFNIVIKLRWRRIFDIYLLVAGKFINKVKDTKRVFIVR